LGHSASGLSRQVGWWFAYARLSSLTAYWPEVALVSLERLTYFLAKIVATFV